MSGGPGRDFWAFTLRVYGNAGVSDALIALQDGHGADVNVLLFCLWAAEAGFGPLDRAELDAAVAAVARWQNEVIVPLRSVRRVLKSPAPIAGPSAPVQALALILREDVKAAELSGEHVAQNILATVLTRKPAGPPDPAAGAAAAAANLSAYLGSLGVDARAEIRAALETLIGAVWPGLTGDRGGAALSAGPP